MEAPRFSSIHSGYQTEAGGLQSQSDSLARFLEQWLGLIRRQFLLILSITVFVIGIGVAQLMTTAPVYTSHSRVMLDTNRASPFQQQNGPIIYFQVMDLSSIMTQLEVLKSDGVAQRVVQNLHLAEDANFVTPGVAGLFEGISERLFGKTAKSPDTRSQTELGRTALATILGRRTVTRVPETYVLDVGYNASSPDLAAKMANALADAYIDEQLDAKYQTVQRANGWLQDRIKELRAQAAAADHAVFEYKQNNKIIEVGGAASSRSLDEDQVVQLNAQLIGARGAAAEAKARLDRITEIMQQDVPDAGTADSLSSGIIAGLRNQYLELDRRARIFADRYGATHLAVVNLRTQIAEIRRSIADELNRIAQSYKSDYEIANARVKTVEKNLAGVIANAQVINRDRIPLTDLETTAKIYRSIYDNFLNRYMEANQQQSFPSTQARVISPAQPGSQSAPNAHKVLTTSIMLGLVIGFAAAWLREARDRVFRTRNQVETALRTNCLAVLPRLTAPANVTSLPVDSKISRTGSDSSSLIRIVNLEPKGALSHVVDDPHSIFAEELRSVKVAADIASAIKENKIIGVTSSVPKEGKSTLSVNLAELMAHAGKRVILIDGDLRTRTLSRMLARSASSGLLEVLGGQTDLQQTLYSDPRTGLQFLPAVVEAQFCHTDEILASKACKTLLDNLRKDYQYIIIDLPPLAPVADVRATAGLIDTYIYAIEWGRVKINLVQSLLSAAPEVYERLLGVVLTKADLKRFGRYEYGGYYKYESYRYRQDGSI